MNTFIRQRQTVQANSGNNDNNSNNKIIHKITIKPKSNFKKNISGHRTKNEIAAATQLMCHSDSVTRISVSSGLQSCLDDITL